MLPNVVVTSFKRRLTGVTTTMRDAVTFQSKIDPELSIGILGKQVNSDLKRVAWLDIIRFGWQRPSNKPFRVWHARRNSEMLLGLILRYVLRMKFRLVFTSAAIRRHSFFPRLLIASMDEVIAVSDQAADLVQNARTVAPHGVDLDKFAPSADRSAVGQMLDADTFRDGNINIGLFGRIRPEKGTDLFIDALCKVLPNHADAQAFVVGYCTPSRLAFQNQLKTKVQTAGLENRVHFIGEVPFDQINKWFQAMHLCVASARYEGYGMTPLEAMACSCAVLATDTGAFSDFIEQGASGYVIPVDDLEALTGKLDLMLSDPATLDQMGKVGRTRAEAGFSIQNEATIINSVYAGMWQNDTTAKV